MKKYKHKTIPELIAIFNEENNRYYCKLIGENICLIKQLVENSNDWELVESSLSRADTIKLSQKEEPNYLITAFRKKGTNTVYHIGTDGLYGRSGISQYTLLEDDSIEIYSVKNSKGEEFTIGDTVTDKVEAFKIQSFELNDAYLGGCFARGKGDGRMAGCSIKLLEKVKMPIYTTTDGVDIMEGDKLTLFPLEKDLTIGTLRSSVIIKNFSKQDKEVADRYLTFTSEENRDKYIKENSKKPIFVSADGKEMFEGDKYYVPQTDERSQLIGSYLDFTVDERTLEKGSLKFSTRESAQEYIDGNKPKFSLVDVIKTVNNCNMTHFNKFELIEGLKKLGK